MKYVIDTSVGFKWVVSEIDSDKAIRLRDDFNNGIDDLWAPGIFPTEIGNALAVAERSGRIQPGEAALFFADIQTKHSVYDCLDVALAERENCELFTAADKLVKNLQAQFVFIKALSSLP